MAKYISVTLSRNEFGQVVDGLRERMIVWRKTAEYLETGCCEPGFIIEECYDAKEASAIAGDYERIIEQISGQL